MKTWGPFSGRQLTLIAVTLIVAVFVPGTVWAIDTFSNVAIEDPVSGAKASVDSGKHLLVGDGAGALTVDGSVTAKEAQPSTLVKSLLGISFDCTSSVYTPPAGKALIIKSATFYSYPSSGRGELDLFEGPTGGNTCQSFVAAGSSDQDQTIAYDLGAGVAIPAGHSLNVHALANSGSVEIFGYLVPASSVPATAAPAAASGVTGSPTHGVAVTAKIRRPSRR